MSVAPTAIDGLRFTSFCRVGTGLSDDELDAVVTKLNPYFRKYEYAKKKAPPNFYHVTNHSKERPDVWVESSEKSLILAITSDIRTMSSEVLAAPYSLRFPRIDRVIRWDKPWHECLDVQCKLLLNWCTQAMGTIQQANKNDAPTCGANCGKHFGKGTVKGETGIFSKRMLCILLTEL